MTTAVLSAKVVSVSWAWLTRATELACSSSNIICVYRSFSILEVRGGSAAKTGKPSASGSGSTAMPIVCSLAARGSKRG